MLLVFTVLVTDDVLWTPCPLKLYRCALPTYSGYQVTAAVAAETPEVLPDT